MPVELVADGTATGEPHYLVFEPEVTPWTSTIREIIEDTNVDLDKTVIFLITTGRELAPVHIRSIDEEPDWMDWEVTLVEGGHLVERVELNGGDGGWEDASRMIWVNGF